MLDWSHGNMEKNLILTGWGIPEYVAAAAVAFKALSGHADVMGVSRRRLPELLDEIDDTWSNVYLLGVSLSGDVPVLAEALKRLKNLGVKVVWISAFDMPEEFRQDLDGLIVEQVFDNSLLEAVGRTFNTEVEELRLVLSPSLSDHATGDAFRHTFKAYEGQRMLPARFTQPSEALMQMHREHLVAG